MPISKGEFDDLLRRDVDGDDFGEPFEGWLLPPQAEGNGRAQTRAWFAEQFRNVFVRARVTANADVGAWKEALEKLKGDWESWPQRVQDPRARLDDAALEALGAKFRKALERERTEPSGASVQVLVPAEGDVSGGFSSAGHE